MKGLNYALFQAVLIIVSAYGGIFMVEGIWNPYDYTPSMWYYMLCFILPISFLVFIFKVWTSNLNKDLLKK